MNLLRFISSVLLLFSPGLHAQNLVPNGSFEDYSACPGSYTQHPVEFRAISWRGLTRGTPDYFNTCSEGEAAVPYNWAGVSDAYDGYGYAGIYTWMNFIKEYREYLHCKLNEPLVKDSVYVIEFRYKLSSYSKFCTDRIGLLLSDTLMEFNHDRPLDIPPTVTFVKDSALTPETGLWETAKAEYRAKGNEQFLTIGNFADNDGTGFYHIRFRPSAEPMLENSAYYYIDDVSVVPKYMTSEDRREVLPEEPELNTVYVLENIRFEFNSYRLMPVSYEALDRVVAWLGEHPDIAVQLSGHTDDVGQSTYNLTLSSRRAQSAAAYLISNGIARDRVLTSGFGESKPLDARATEAAREKNRRVEIEFFKP